MLQLSLRQIKILDHLLRNEVSHIDDLLAYAQISNRTLQSEILIINQELERCQKHIVINSNRNRGYSAEPNDQNREAYESLKYQCSAYLNNEVIFHYGDNPRIAYLIRKFLCAKDYVRGDDLIDEMNISMATLTNDLRYVRTILDFYGIHLNSTPYYGMKIEADSYQVRSCLIDFCDIYDSYLEQYDFMPMAIKQYQIDPTHMKDIRIKLAKILQQFNIHLRDLEFQRLYFYLLIKVNGYDLYPFDEGFIIQGNDAFTLCAKMLLECFHIEESEFKFIKLLLLTGSQNLPKELMEQGELGNHLAQIMGDLQLTLSKTIHLDIGRKAHILDFLETYVYEFLLMKRNGIRVMNNRMNTHEIVRMVPVSTSLSLQILEMIKRITHFDYIVYDVLNLTVQLFNAIFIVNNEYHMIHVAFIGQFSGDTSVSTSNRVMTAERYNIHRDFYSFYEIDSIDFTKYDCIFIVEAKGMRLTNCPVKVFYVDYFNYMDVTRRFYNEVLAKHRIENFLLYKTDNKVHLSIPNEKGNWLNELMESLSSYGYDHMDAKAMIQWLIEQDTSMYQMDPLVICLLWKKELEHTLFIYDITNPIVLHGFTISQIQIVVMDPNDNVLAIKQADSYVRRMQDHSLL